MKQLVLALLIFLLAPSLCLAQAAKKIPVAVTHDGDDQVGQSLAFALKEAIRGSQSFFLVDHDTLPESPRIVVRMVSLDLKLSSEQPGLDSAIAIVIVYDSLQTPGNGVYITSTIQLCGRKQVEFCAKRRLPDIDWAVESLRKTEPSLWKTL